MGRSYFIFNGVDCRSMGVILSGPAPIIRAEERVNHVQIPGIAGDLTEVEGENIYNSYIQTVTMMVHGAYNVRNVFKWLRGSGYVTFSGENDKRQPARVIGAVTLNRHSYNLDWWEGEVQFYCQPLKERMSEDVLTLTESGLAVNNGGDVTCRPLWKVKASGTSFTIVISGKTFTVTGTTSNRIYHVDSETMEVIDTSNSNAVTKNSSGAFPVLAVGNNTITGSGWSKIEVVRRERFL